MNSKRRLRVPRSRATPKKPKFLSLRRQFPPRGTDTTGSLTLIRQSSSTASAWKPDSQQLNLFPLEPQNQMENQEHENVACFFSAADGSATTLTGLLLDNAVESNSSHVTNDSSRPDDLSPSASLTYADRRKDSEDRAALERNALRNRERESSEEKWVCYSKVVERKVKEEEVSSSVADLWRAGGDQAPLSLKLDYEDIVKAWSGRGPLYINYGEATQIVPDITDDILLPNNGVKAEGSVGTWTVPEMVEEKGEIRLKKGQREASVLRYKAKRQNRLFSKKIRYQVRKLNAEKRPRIKGRFVKRG